MVRSVRNRWCFGLATAAVVLALGCKNEPRHGRGGSAAGTGTENMGAEGGLNAAEQLLEQMIKTYAKADSYADQGELLIQFQAGGRPNVSRVPFSVMLVRPNKLRVHLYQATYLSDGRNAWGWAEDLPGYILKRPAPSTLTLGEVYADPVLRSLLSE